MARVAILDDYQGIALSMADWKGLPAGSEVTAFRDHLADEDALVQRLAGFEVVVAMRERTPFPGRLLQRLPSLKLLVTTGGRNASIDLAAAHEHGIVVCGTRSLATPTSELTWGLILGLVRNIPAEDRSIRDGGWQTGAGPSLEGKTLGVMGLGNLGTRVTSVALAFGMEVIAWSQNLTAERAEAAGARLVTKDELLAQSDVLTIHLVLSDRTRGIVSRRDLDLMKPTAYLVNTSRGPIVDEQALVESLVAGRIAGAAIDVFDEEPLPAGHPLRSLPNTVVTPHIGYVTADNYRLFYGDVVEDINAFYAGQPIRLLQPSQ
jgi:phosphoglycerate dehydrogenase-like enzyme